jgi:hypothetical protein
LALEEVNKRIRAYEEEKARLTAESEGTGVKALGAKNMLAQIESSPLKEELNKVKYLLKPNLSLLAVPKLNDFVNPNLTLFFRL